MIIKSWNDLIAKIDKPLEHYNINYDTWKGTDISHWTVKAIIEAISDGTLRTKPTPVTLKEFAHADDGFEEYSIWIRIGENSNPLFVPTGRTMTGFIEDE